MYSTRLHVCTRASLTDNLARIIARKSARVGRVGGQVGEDVRIGVGPMEFKLYGVVTPRTPHSPTRRVISIRPVRFADHCWQSLLIMRLHAPRQVVNNRRHRLALRERRKRVVYAETI